MDFWTDIAFAVIFRLLKDRRIRQEYRPAFIKLAQLLTAWLEADELATPSKAVAKTQ